MPPHCTLYHLHQVSPVARGCQVSGHKGHTEMRSIGTSARQFRIFVKVYPTVASELLCKCPFVNEAVIVLPWGGCCHTLELLWFRRLKSHDVVPDARTPMRGGGTSAEIHCIFCLLQCRGSSTMLQSVGVPWWLAIPLRGTSASLSLRPSDIEEHKDRTS